MRTYEEIQESVAGIFKFIRKKHGLSKLKMSQMLFLDDKTWSRYESGESSPPLANFLWMLDYLGEDAMRLGLNTIYPDIYSNVTQDSDVEQLRNVAAHFFKHVASDRMVREWYYILCGQHGSSIEPQMQLFTMYDHLPLESRVVVANTIYTIYQICKNKRDLIGENRMKADEELVAEGIKKGMSAVKDGRRGYASIIKDENEFKAGCDDDSNC